MYSKFVLLLLSSILLLHCTLANVSTEKGHLRTTTPSSTSTTSTTHFSSTPSHASLPSSATVKNEATTKSTTHSTTQHHEHSKEHSDSKPLEDNFFTHFKTLLLVLQDFHYLTFSTLENAQFFFTNVIADVTTSHDQTEQLKMKIKELTKFVVKVDRFRHSVKLLDDFTHTLDSLNATAKEKPSAEDLIIDASMRKNKLETIERNFAHGYNAYGKKLAKELHTFETSLPGKEQANDSDIKAWIVEIKDLTKKIASYGEFFDKQTSGMHQEKSKI